ncbi:hypothetical protein GJ633_03985 [Halorubrum sp. CBA1125]|uniref:hypothetical protein n=1 Tax=Halorubrum sp. CBA1125 TaxID=2668072 RepID=UPI0012E789B8|nr:hypothetical protein [Halorubrum sp. CBA1125]MUW13911.1 hypothetical protein [Halorubrum sp. CBA1125]
MTRTVTVEIRSAQGTDIVDLEACVLATDAALVDQARQQAGVSGGEFKQGQVIA